MSDKAKMKEALRSGSVVVSPPRSGKTEALVEIYHEDKDAFVVLPNEAGYRRFVDLYYDKYGKIPDKGMILISSVGPSVLPDDLLKVKKVYVDELALSKYIGTFHSAITSFPQPLVIIERKSEAV